MSESQKTIFCNCVHKPTGIGVNATMTITMRQEKSPTEIRSKAEMSQGLTSSNETQNECKIISKEIKNIFR